MSLYSPCYGNKINIGCGNGYTDTRAKSKQKKPEAFNTLESWTKKRDADLNSEGYSSREASLDENNSFCINNCD